MKWKFYTEYGTSQAAAIGEDGTIYVGTEYLYAIHPNGTLKWKFALNWDHWIGHSSPAISADGSIYFGTHIGTGGGGAIYAVNPNGTERWKKRIAYWLIDSSPSIAPDGTVYIGSYYDGSRGYLHAFGKLDPNAPSAPDIDGTKNGKVDVEYEYTFKSISPLGRDVYYYIEWGDGSIKDWFGPYGSGEEATASHTWSEQGTYTIKAKVKDVFDAESGWSTLEVSMPKNKPRINSWFFWFFERLIENFPLLEQILASYLYMGKILHL